MTVIAIKSIVKNVLEQTGALAAHNGISFHGLEIAIRRIGGENLHLPLAFRIVAVSVRVNLGSEIVDSRLLAAGVHCVLDVEQGGRGYRRCGLEQELFRGLVQVDDGFGALADDLEVVFVITAVESEV